MPSSAATEESVVIAKKALDSVQLPSVPEAAAGVLTLCRDMHVGAEQIVRVVELDPALAARVLKMANSAFFGQRNQVDTLTRAAAVLGNRNLKTVALSFFVGPGWESVKCDTLDIREFWRDCIVRACLAGQLSAATKFEPAEQAFLVGLLQNVGTLVMGTYFGSAYGRVLRTEGHTDIDLLAAERAEFGTDHAEIVEVLARSWNFPDTLVTALSKHCIEPPAAGTKDPAEVLHQIAYFCAAVPFSPNRQTAQLKTSLRNLATCAFGLSFESLSRVFTRTVEEYNTVRSVFANLDPPRCDEIAMMEQAAELMRQVDADAPDQPPNF